MPNCDVRLAFELDGCLALVIGSLVDRCIVESCVRKVAEDGIA